MGTDKRVDLMGAPGSPYTRKMLALLRYRHIPYKMLWGGHQSPIEGYPVPKVKLLPTFYFEGADGSLEAHVDSTPITRKLECDWDGRSVLPEDPELAFYNELIEDFADEWLTKAMFHYRWFHEADRLNAGPLLVYWSMNRADPKAAKTMSDNFTDRQYKRLYVVGSNAVTAQTIEDSYQRTVDVLDKLLPVRGYVLGARPSSADFAIYAQLTQLGVVEPTSAAVLARRSPRVRAWLDLMEDLSGLDPKAGDWFAPDEARVALAPLLSEIGRVYAPFLLANHAAVQAGEAQFETEIDGRAWTQPAFPYQAKCLGWLREAYATLPANARPPVEAALSGTGCEALFD